MSSYDYDIGIIGGGAAGLTVTAGAAQFGAKALLIEKSPRLGGDCLHYGCVPSKTLIRTAGVWALARRSREFGLPRLELPVVDLGAAMDRVAAVIAKIQEHDSPERFCKLGAEVWFGPPSFVDDHQVEIDGRRVSARAWVIATGSRPALPPVEGLDAVPYWTNETVFSQRALPARLLVLGGGPIGLELAQAFQRLGSRVTVVEFLDQIMGTEDADVAEVVRGRLEAEGMKILTGTKALRAGRRGAAITLAVTQTKGGEPRELEADALLVAAGRRPNVEGLALEAAGVTYGPKGVPTDSRMRTSRAHIFAAGDINGVLPFTHVAGYEGGIALTNAVLRLPRKADYTNVPWCTYTDPEVASVGFNEKRAQKAGVACRVLEESFAENDRALAEAEPLGKIKVLVSPRGTILGCQIVGAHAGELIHEWIAAVSGGVKLSTLAGAIHVYPTLSEISKRAAGSYFSAKIFSDRTKRILHLLFGLKGRACAPSAPAPNP
jgi:pyruvate/2-oxoglutarate dehydrogenase complex dihydrolipoamide dehydrogenase (E3) component